ncbi:MAG: hypothetical protein AAGD96_05695 [Chloroflexota bacterium]
MRRQSLKSFVFLLLMAAAAVGCVDDSTETVEVAGEGLITIENGVPEMESAGVMAFGPSNELLVADNQTGTIFSFEVDGGRGPFLFAPYNIVNVDQQIAALLGLTVDQISIIDMVVHPANRKAYLSTMVDDGEAETPAIFIVDHEGFIELIDLADLSYSSITIERLPDEGVVFGNNITARSLAITDIDYYDGALFVSGLSNAERSSEIRRIPYPFDGTVAYASTEIYHTTNDQMESRAPIRSQAIIESESGPLLLAAYTGTPLVTFPLSDLQDGAQVEGKTVAELGYGSSPIDLLLISESGTPKVMMSHTGYNLMTFELDQVLQSDAAGGLTAQVAQGSIEGVETANTAISAVDQLSDLDTLHVLMLRRNRETGNLDLVSTIKSIYFRLSDFQSEYDSVGYEYPSSQQVTKLFQNVMRLNEGHRDEVVLP